MDGLLRSRHDRWLAGVAGGMAEMWDLDPALVRLGWVILTLLTGGLAILVYIVLAIVVPQEPAGGFGPSGTAHGQASTAPSSAASPIPPAAPAAGPTPPAAPAGPAGPGGASPGSAGAPGQAGWMPGAATWRDQRREERARRHAEHEAWRARRRAARGGRPDDTAIVAGVVLILVGAVVFASQVLPAFDWGLAWPIGLIVLGGLLIARSASRGDPPRP